MKREVDYLALSEDFLNSIPKKDLQTIIDTVNNQKFHGISIDDYLDYVGKITDINYGETLIECTIEPEEQVLSFVEVFWNNIDIDWNDYSDILPSGGKEKTCTFLDVTQDKISHSPSVENNNYRLAA